MSGERAKPAVFQACRVRAACRALPRREFGLNTSSGSEAGTQPDLPGLFFFFSYFFFGSLVYVECLCFTQMPFVLFFPFYLSLSLLLFQMDLDEDTAEQLYQNLLELEKQVRVTIQKNK